MATIALYASKINNMPGLINDVKKSVTDFKSELSNLKNKSLQVNKSICNLDDVISAISTSTQTQEQKVASLESFQKNSEQFITDTARIDSDVADIVNQRKDDFYDKYHYLKPDCEKGFLEKAWDDFKSDCAKAWEWCKEHWKLIVVVVLVVVAIVVLVCTAGTTAGPMLILIGACKGLITGAIIGGVMGGFSSMANGGSFWDGFENGAFSGALTGALFGGIGGAFQTLGSSCQFLSKLGLLKNVGGVLKYTEKGIKMLKIISTIAKVSGGLSLGMFGFDFLAAGAGAFFGKDNPFTAFNAKLHESALYNTFQITTGLVALGTGSFAKGMRTPVCFVAGTMILTAAGVVAIENIKAGNKVISTNEDTWETGEKTVLRTFVNDSHELAHVFVNGEEIIATPSHLYYVADKGWVPASSLSQGSVLILPDASCVEVERVILETLEEPVKVYNFEVADWHTYHVGNAGVLVHNDCRPETAVLGSKKHGIKWKEGSARAKATGNPQGQWSKPDIDFATKMANTLKSGESGTFNLPKGSTSIVYMPDGSTVNATKFWIWNKGTTWHGYPMP